MSSAAQVTAYACKNRSVKDGAAYFPAVTESYVNTVSYSLDFENTSVLARSRGRLDSLSTLAWLDLVDHVVQRWSVLNSIGCCGVGSPEQTELRVAVHVLGRGNNAVPWCTCMTAQAFWETRVTLCTKG